jgi:hypothetical protein
MTNQAAQSGPFKAITLRRDGKGALKFKGERIGDAKRTAKVEDDNNETKSYEISARLYRTATGKHIMGVEVYNRTDECYDSRDGWVKESAAALAQEVKGAEVDRFGSSLAANWLDDDILGELFEKTEIADKFVEHID